jgi:hypothetical protein
MEDNLIEYISFNWKHYISCYPDLMRIENKDDAWHHWIFFGKKEDRKIIHEINKKKFTIVYKTYKNDIEWLKYSLLSLIKNLDFDNILEIIIYTHDVVYEDINNLIQNINIIFFIHVRVIPIHYNFHGYVKQQTVKANCYKDCKTEYIVILDSDLLLGHKINFDEYIMENGKIKWRYLKIEDAPECFVFDVWKKACEDSNKQPFTSYYMANMFPFIFTKRSLKNAANNFIEMHGCDYDEYCHKRCDNEGIRVEDSVLNNFNKLSKIFSEFEYLGFYCHHYSNDYYFSNVIDKPNHFIQNWSHGGITNEVKQLIDSILC